MSALLNEILNTLKLSNICRVSVGASSIQFVSESPKITAVSTCDFNTSGSGVSHVYSTEVLLAGISDCTKIEEIDESLVFTQETDTYKIVNTIQPLLQDLWTYEIPEQWNTKVIVEVDAFKKFIFLQQDIETSIYLSAGILYFHSEEASNTSIMQITHLDILQEGTERVTVHFASLKYLSGLLARCEKVTIMYTKECLSFVLMFEGDAAYHRAIFNGIR
ncbi:hypothetical protein NERG_02115 [Nematocida ausubeli]|uniref:Uncharacterized protein n=1 Tax=Nematocida ausubeli (strain ATCC PRA-371 / ERTm2) TaxID=1913371 RepID=H8ZEU6_NEMA1|nr:hypothetical protein NERG_02115 [Nematocida ausubeli]